MKRAAWLRSGTVHAARAVVIGIAALYAPLAAHGATPLHAPRVANYVINATYDAGTQTITGHEVLTWRNVSDDAATHLYFHLYLNAFANNRSTFMREWGEGWSEWLRRHPDGWGYSEIQHLRVGGTDLSSRLQFVHPDDDNIDDRTVVRVPLDAPIGPRQTIKVEIDFVTKLPKIVSRSGYAGPFAMVAQWFPKVGVFQGGAWNCHQYHRDSEFFADFGQYDVSLTVPRAGVVGATGVLKDEHTNGDGTKTLHFRADAVHDFAWTFDPRFRVFEREVDGIQVRFLLQPGHVGQFTRHAAAAKVAMDYYRDWVGEYPYEQLTIVDPGPGGSRAGGMEYPNLITVGTTWWMPTGIRLPEIVTIHEFGHQYWYGMVASNEFEDAWLDEGINSYFESRIMDAAYGAGSYIHLFGLQFSAVPLLRLSYLAASSHDPMVQPAWRFIDHQSYQAISYAKTALVLETLGRQLGVDRLEAGLHTYFNRWRFKHPRTSDFIEAMNAGSGEDLRWYFDQVIPGTGVLDYAVTRVNAYDVEGFAGYPFAGGRTGTVVQPETPPERWYQSEVVVERLGTVVMPVKLQIGFDDGTNTSEEWDGRERWKRFEYRGNQRVEWAVVDPGFTMPLDYNRLNNSRMREGGTRGLFRLTSRWGFWFQSLVMFLSGL